MLKGKKRGEIGQDSELAPGLLLLTGVRARELEIGDMRRGYDGKAERVTVHVFYADVQHA